MVDQSAPAPAPDPAHAAMARSFVNTPPPNVPTRTPSAEEMRNANLTAGQRGQTNAERSADYMRQYDRPSEAKPADVPAGTNAERPPSESSTVAEQPVDRDQLERDVSAFRKWQADAKVRAELLPDPSAYKIVLPETFKTPPGVEFRFKDGDPMLEQARQWAHRRGLDQEGFSEALGLYAGELVRKEAEIMSLKQAEVKKLGEAAPARVDSVLRWMENTVGKDSARALASMLITADIVTAFEKIITSHANGGVISSPGGGAREPVPRGPTDEQYKAWGFGERITYAREASAPVKARR